MTIESIVEDALYIALTPDGTEINRRAKRDKCLEDFAAYAAEHGIYGEYRIIQPEVKVTLGAAKFSHGTITPTPDGDVDTRFPDGDDSGAAAPSIPVLGQPAVLGSTKIDIPLATASTGGTPPLAYTLERSATSATSGFAIIDANAVFGEEGYHDTGLVADTRYWYRAKAVDADLRESGYSDVVDAITAAEVAPPPAPGEPTNISILTVGETTAEDISWTLGTDAASTRLIVNTGDGTKTQTPSSDQPILDTTLLSPTNFFDIVSGLDPDTEYYLRLCSQNETGSACANRVWFTTQAESVPPEEPVGDFLFTWDHSNEPIGPAQDVANIWKTSVFNDPDTAQDGTEWIITDENPLIVNGGRYFQSTVNKDAGANHFRAERRFLVGTGVTKIPRIDVGGDDVKAEYKYFLGFLMRIDIAGTNNDDPRGFYIQTHSPSFIGNSTSPVFFLRGRGSGISGGIKHKENSTPGGADNYSIEYSPQQLTNLAWRGTVHAWIFEYLMDGRTEAEGWQGTSRIYLDDSTTPFFEVIGRNITWGLADLDGRNEMGYVNHGNYSVGTHTGLYRQSFDRFCVMGPNGTRAEVLDYLQWDKRTS